MAISRLLKTEIVCAVGDDARLLKELERERMIHIDDVHDGLPAEYAEMESTPVIDAADEEAGLQKAKNILDTFSETFTKGLTNGSTTTMKMKLTADELSEINAKLKEKRNQG